MFDQKPRALSTDSVYTPLDSEDSRDEYVVEKSDKKGMFFGFDNKSMYFAGLFNNIPLYSDRIENAQVFLIEKEGKDKAIEQIRNCIGADNFLMKIEPNFCVSTEIETPLLHFSGGQPVYTTKLKNIDGKERYIVFPTEMPSSMRLINAQAWFNILNRNNSFNHNAKIHRIEG
jgi:hypothetical protein